MLLNNSLFSFNHFRHSLMKREHVIGPFAFSTTPQAVGADQHCDQFGHLPLVQHLQIVMRIRLLYLGFGLIN